jgi:hypothetical protein
LISKLISDRGVFVAQVGEAPALDWPAAENSVIQNRYRFVQSLLGSGFTSVVDYEEVRFECSASRRFLLFATPDNHCLYFFAGSSWLQWAMAVLSGVP